MPAQQPQPFSRRRPLLSWTSVPNKLLYSPLPLKTQVASSLTSKDAKAKVEVQQTAGESREDEAKRGEDAPNHHYGARPPAGAQGAAHWAYKEAE